MAGVLQQIESKNRSCFSGIVKEIIFQKRDGVLVLCCASDVLYHLFGRWGHAGINALCL